VNRGVETIFNAHSLSDVTYRSDGGLRAMPNERRERKDERIE
jgi:hypothetical protein